MLIHPSPAVQNKELNSKKELASQSIKALSPALEEAPGQWATQLPTHQIPLSATPQGQFQSSRVQEASRHYFSPH